MFDDRAFSATAFSAQAWFIQLVEQIALWRQYEQNFRTIVIASSPRIDLLAATERAVLVEAEAVTLLESERDIVMKSEIRLAFLTAESRLSVIQASKRGAYA